RVERRRERERWCDLAAHLQAVVAGRGGEPADRQLRLPDRALAGAGIADVSPAVAVPVGLIGVRVGRAVVGAVAHPVAVGVGTGRQRGGGGGGGRGRRRGRRRRRRGRRRERRRGRHGRRRRGRRARGGRRGAAGRGGG